MQIVLLKTGVMPGEETKFDRSEEQEFEENIVLFYHKSMCPLWKYVCYSNTSREKQQWEKVQRGMSEWTPESVGNCVSQKTADPLQWEDKCEKIALKYVVSNTGSLGPVHSFLNKVQNAKLAGQAPTRAQRPTLRLC